MKRPGSLQGVLSRRACGELGTLEASVQQLGSHRSAALRLFLASRHATTALAEFCSDHGNPDAAA